MLSQTAALSALVQAGVLLISLSLSIVYHAVVPFSARLLQSGPQESQLQSQTFQSRSCLGTMLSWAQPPRRLRAQAHKNL